MATKAPERTQSKGVELSKCGRKKKSGGTCKHPAGYMTDHPGAGPCRLHGGQLPAVKAAVAREAIKAEAGRLGLSLEVEPHDLMLSTVYATAGVLQHAQARVAEVGPEDEDTERGRFAQERQQAALHLARQVAKDAMTAGVSDRRIRLAQRWGELIAQAAERAMGRMAEHFSPQVRAEFAGHFQAEMLRLERGEIEEA